jgi:hypothetical protein
LSEPAYTDQVNQATQPEIEFPDSYASPQAEEQTQTYADATATARPAPRTGKPLRARKPRRQRAPGTRRRVALIAITLYMLLIFISYALYMYSPAECVLGPYCSSATFTSMPLLVFVGMIVFGLALLYAITVWPLTIALDENQPPPNEVSRFLRQAARFETVRPLLMGFAALVLLLLIYGVFFAHALPWLGVLMGLSVVTLLVVLGVTA